MLFDYNRSTYLFIGATFRGSGFKGLPKGHLPCGGQSVCKTPFHPSPK